MHLVRLLLATCMNVGRGRRTIARSMEAGAGVCCSAVAESRGSAAAAANARARPGSMCPGPRSRPMCVAPPSARSPGVSGSGSGTTGIGGAEKSGAAPDCIALATGDGRDPKSA